MLSFHTAEKWIQSRPAAIFGENRQKGLTVEQPDRQVDEPTRIADAKPQSSKSGSSSFTGVIQNMGMTERTDRKGRKYQSFVLVLEDENGIQNEFLGVGLARLASEMKLQVGQKIRLCKETKDIDVRFDGKNTKRLRNEYCIEWV